MDAPTTVPTLYQQLVDTRQQIVDVLFEIDDIQLQQNPAILAEYASSVGYLENDLLKWQLAARRARRKLALMRAAVNSAHLPSNEHLEAALDAEFSQWEQQLAQRMQEQLVNLERKASMRTMAPTKSKELARLHRLLVKRLHPDIHPHRSEEAEHFFSIAQAAYEMGDLQTLRALVTATEDFEASSPQDTPDTPEDDLSVSLAMAEAQLAVVQEQLAALKNSRPHTLRTLLENPRELAQVQKSLEARIDEQKQAAASYEAAIEELVERNHD